MKPDRPSSSCARFGPVPVDLSQVVEVGRQGRLEVHPISASGQERLRYSPNGRRQSDLSRTILFDIPMASCRYLGERCVVIGPIFFKHKVS
jgi:hypothetical protein